MTVLHVVSSQTLDQVQHDGHVCYFFSECLPALDETDFLIDALDLVGEALVLLDEDIGFDLSPEFGLPVVVLKIGEGNQIPKSLKVLQISKTLLQRLVISSLQLEEIL